MPSSVEKHNLLVQWLTVVVGSIYGLTFSQWISLGVLVTGLVTMLINWHYKQKHLELEQQKLQLQMKAQFQQQPEDSTP